MKINNRPLPNSWWKRNGNGKRYYLRNYVGTGPNERAVLFLENTNRALHLPLATVLKRYTPIDTIGHVTIIGKITDL